MEETSEGEESWPYLPLVLAVSKAQFYSCPVWDLVTWANTAPFTKAQSPIKTRTVNKEVERDRFGSNLDLKQCEVKDHVFHLCNHSAQYTTGSQYCIVIKM